MSQKISFRIGRFSTELKKSHKQKNIKMLNKEKKSIGWELGEKDWVVFLYE